MNRKTNHKPWLLLCIPVLLAAFLIWRFSDSQAAEKVALSSPVIGDVEYDALADVQFFSSLIADADVIEEAVRPLEEYETLNLTVTEGFDQKTPYTLLLSGSPADCLFTDEASTLYRIQPEQATTLLMKEELQYVNPYYSYPTVSIRAGGKELSLTEAQSIDWSYQAADESFLQRNTQGNAGITFVLPREQAPELNFSRLPHWTNVTVTKDESELYNGTAEDFSSFHYDGDGDLKVQLTAKWNKDKNCDYYGESKLSFVLRCDAPAAFAIQSESCFAGDPVVILAKNCLNGSVSVSSSLPGAEKAKSVLYEGEKLILLPVSLTAKPGKYRIDVTGEGMSHSFTLTVNERTTETENLTNLDIAALEQAFARDDAFLRELCGTPSSEPHWNQKFSFPIEVEDPINLWISNGFGYPITVDGASTNLLHTGFDYVSEANSHVGAVSDGVVVFAGKLDYYGNTVVVDHGLGIYSVYGYLDYVSVEQGDEVYQTQTVGTLGKSGFAGGTCLHFEMRLLGESISPYFFLGENPDFLDYSTWNME